jgi:hypothetical protein
MTTADGLEVLHQFHENPWEFQQTFETPLRDLPRFVARIVSAGGPLQGGSLIIDLVVFEPRNLIDMLVAYSIQPRYERGLCLTAAGQQEVEQLLRVVLSDWIDFLFLPAPQTFAIYADHDEFTTLYGHTRTDLERVAGPLPDGGFKVEPDFIRTF